MVLLPYQRSFIDLPRGTQLRLHERAMAGVAARERKRLHQAAAMRDVGGLLTDGCLGTHSVRLLAYDSDERRMAIVMDGRHRQARTYRGILRCLAETLARNMQ